jgi:DNA primase
MLVLEADERKWEEGIKELRDWYKQDTANVRELFCKIPESPGDSAEGDAYAAQLAQIADRMRDRLKPKWQTIGNEAAAMITRAEVLSRSKQKPVRTDAFKLKDVIIKKMASLQNLLDNELNGSNDPEVRAKMEFGKNEHKRIQADSSKCTVSEIPFGNRRVDCIRVSGSTCYVVEIKPNNSDAQKLGRSQIRDGIKEILNELKGKKKKSDLDGKFEVFRACFDESAETVKLEEELRVYEYCPPEGELYKDFVIQ